ncbi:MAG: threonine--tRNA ligase [DPANN group archaeon]|nr:threonine--tRNA ligase [DPANN group archaeon]
MAKPVRFRTDADKKAFWHSTSHILADAVTRLYPDVKLGFGPAIEEGFYYDFYRSKPFDYEELQKIEQVMKKIIKEDKFFKQIYKSKKEANEFYQKEPFKKELIKEIEENKISFHKHGEFADLCNNPVIESAGQVKAFKLLNTAAAYWRGDNKREMMQRIYGISFPTKEQLDEYLALLEARERKDHRKIGPKLKLFTQVEEVGTGLPLWLPKGATIRRVIERYITDKELKEGYEHVYTPALARTKLYELSGHLNHYRDHMYPVMKVDTEDLVLRPMNCPHHIQIYKFESRSYNDLPIRLAELGTMYRYEASGALYGLARVRGMTLNDAHIFCTPEQVEDEVKKALKFIRDVYADMGLIDYYLMLSLHDPKNKEKYIDNDVMWKKSENSLRKVLKSIKVDFVEKEGEAAFYGPKIDVQVKNVHGKEETLATIQLDFNLPEKFQLEYVDNNNQKKRPVMIHRGGLSTMERLTAFLIERYEGAFPLWLSPVQVRVLTFTDRNVKFADKIKEEFLQQGLRIETDYSNRTVEYKVRDAELNKIPYIIVIGDKEEKNKTLAVRKRGVQGVKFGIKMEDFSKQLQKEIDSKA